MAIERADGIPPDARPAGMDAATAAWYVEHYGDHPTNRLAIERAGLVPDDVVIDVGCGGGSAARQAAELATRGLIVGIDPSEAMLALAAEATADHAAVERIHYRIGHAGHLPVPDASATVVLAVNSLHHWIDLDRGLAEIHRVLIPGGRLVITEEDPGDGRFGHSEGSLSDPEAVVRRLIAAGFVGAEVSRHASDAGTLFALVARTEAGPIPAIR